MWRNTIRTCTCVQRADLTPAACPLTFKWKRKQIWRVSDRAAMGLWARGRREGGSRGKIQLQAWRTPPRKPLGGLQDPDLHPALLAVRLPSRNRRTHQKRAATGLIKAAPLVDYTSVSFTWILLTCFIPCHLVNVVYICKRMWYILYVAGIFFLKRALHMLGQVS